jgi:hypothetical protein
MGKAYLAISGGIFCLVALLHLMRIIFHAPVQIGGWSVPFWISWGGFVVPAVLCAWALKLITR